MLTDHLHRGSEAKRCIKEVGLPCLPTWPIVKLKLQGAVDGYATDDLIVFVENPANKNERRRLLGQVKNSITITSDIISAKFSTLYFCYKVRYIGCMAGVF
jgi:hypothetical protein